MYFNSDRDGLYDLNKTPEGAWAEFDYSRYKYSNNLILFIVILFPRAIHKYIIIPEIIIIKILNVQVLLSTFDVIIINYHYIL